MTNQTELQKETASLLRDLKSRIFLLLVLVGLMWLETILDGIVFRGGLRIHGIRPRSIAGLQGILFAPFLHAGFAHLISNTVPFLVLGGLVLFDRVRDFVGVTLIVMVLGGLGVWLIAPSHSVHIGASGLIFGYLGFLLFRGFFDRRLPWILTSILVGVLYGGLIIGVLPSCPGISWQSHLFGFIAGVVAAKLYSADKKE